ncbi:XRE family transcriptional regulator [Hymenobacter gummosus]|uniref:XRE family transcriptional regulator n=1 Tax=Hymenobacter gummosus TaxID=1776032 RepID=A0A431TUA4_9BACT|nr:helix-turn-helix transcriptional regulator [Hymenobacter gummosus]RTQ44669.1 XRE family transcriptional regulator [Hymenobacter gummosus]
MSIQEKLGIRVMSLRKERGLSQEALALQAGLDRTYIPAIEKGTRNVSISVAEKLANALGISISELFAEF